MLGLVFLHLAVESSSADIRRSAVGSLASLSLKQPELVNNMVGAALELYLSKEKASSKKSANGEEVEPKVTNTDGRLCAFLLACGSFAEDVEREKREILLVKLVILAHHPIIGEISGLDLFFLS